MGRTKTWKLLDCVSSAIFTIYNTLSGCGLDLKTLDKITRYPGKHPHTILKDTSVG